MAETRRASVRRALVPGAVLVLCGCSSSSTSAPDAEHSLSVGGAGSADAGKSMSAGTGCDRADAAPLALDAALPGSSLSVEQIVTFSGGHHVSLMTWNAPNGPDLSVYPNPGTTILTVDVDPGDPMIQVSPDQMFCIPVVYFPAHIHFATADGALDETWDTVASVSGGDVMFQVDLRAQPPHGTFAVKYVGTEQWDTTNVLLNGRLEPDGAYGAIDFDAQRTWATGPNQGAGMGMAATVASWAPTDADAGSTGDGGNCLPIPCPYPGWDPTTCRCRSPQVPDGGASE